MRSTALVALAVVCALHGVTHAARPGQLDPSFGQGGTVRAPVPLGDVEDLLVLPDGSVVLGGAGDLQGDGRRKVLLARLDSTGALVSGFGDGGVVATDIRSIIASARFRRLALDADGHIVAAGIAQREIPNGPTVRQLVVGRYFQDGTLDRDFGTFGFRGTRPARDVTGILPLPDRSIAFIGRDDDLIAGILRPGFGEDGFAFDESSDGTDVVAHLGGYVMAGSLDRQFFLRRFVEGLEVDLLFGDAGSVRTPIGEGAVVRKLLVLSDGKLMAIGAVTVGLGDVDIGLARYTAEGALDPTFGNGGIVVTPLGPNRDDVLDAALLPGGAMLVGGRTCPTVQTCQGFVARLLPDGRLDPDFADAGLFATTENVAAVALPDADHVLVAEEANGELIVHRLLLSECGNGVVEAGETCDDGNTADGDCCSATCTLEPDDSPCADDGSACTADVCRAGACAHAVPVDAGCFAATASTLTRVTDDRLKWTWLSTTPIDRAQFGNPTATTDVTVCFVNGDTPVLELTLPAAGTCGAAPCWKETHRGFRYKDAAAATDGVARLRLITDAAGSTIELKARNLQGVSDLPAPLTVRLVRHDASACFEASLSPARGTSLQLR